MTSRSEKTWLLIARDGTLDHHHHSRCYDPNSAICRPKKNEVGTGDFWGQLYPVFLCAPFCRVLALVLDAVNRTKPTSNHADVLVLGQHRWINAGDFHSASNHAVQSQELFAAGTAFSKTEVLQAAILRPL